MSFIQNKSKISIQKESIRTSSEVQGLVRLGPDAKSNKVQQAKSLIQLETEGPAEEGK